MVGVDAIRMKNIRLFLTLILLSDYRSFSSKIIKVSGFLIKPVPGLFKSIHAWMPATAGMLTTHALSGATTQVYSKSENSITLKAGESLDYEFYTSPYSAQSFKISGLPEGLDTDFSFGKGVLSGVAKAGKYEVQIIGYRNSGYTGNSTPAFTLNLNIESDESPTVVSSFNPNEISDLGNSWFNSEWFGVFHSNSNSSWIFHSHLHWMYTYTNLRDSLWLYDNEQKWLFTSKELYPYFYRNSDSKWLYHLKDSSSHRFWDYSNGEKI